MPTINTIRRSWLPINDHSRGNDPFYQTKAWKKVRRMYIAAHQLCAICQSKGITTEAKAVDHIIPIKQGGSELSFSNLQSLCNHCHAIKSAKERG
jgi:5-methylcytosine-specific restriction protein A